MMIPKITMIPMIMLIMMVMRWQGLSCDYHIGHVDHGKHDGLDKYNNCYNYHHTYIYDDYNDDDTPPCSN